MAENIDVLAEKTEELMDALDKWFFPFGSFGLMKSGLPGKCSMHFNPDQLVDIQKKMIVIHELIMERKTSDG